MNTEPTTVTGLLHRAARFPTVGLHLQDRHEEVEWRAWAQLREEALAACGGMQALGVRPGERVAVVYPTDWGFFAAFFGALLAGAVPVPLYPPVRLGRLDEYLNRTAAMLSAAGAALVLAERRVKRLLGPAVAGARPRLFCLTVEELPRQEARPVTAEPDQLGLVQFSSGTLVEPKPVALTHAALIAQARLLNAYWPDSDREHHGGVSWLPLYHDMGLIGCLLLALERPAPLTLIRPEDFLAHPALWLRAISRTRATLSVGPCFAYSLAAGRVRDEELEGVDLSCWKVAVCGAETVVPAVLRSFAERFERFGFRSRALTPVYGLSEAALAVTFSDPAQPFVSRHFDRAALAAGRAEESHDGIEIASVGSPLPGFAVEIRSADGEALGEGGVGEILVRGPSLMTGYLDRREATAAAMRDGWLATGDLGFLLGGHLYVAGRRKDVLLLRGRNHAPEEVERAAATVPEVRAGCVVAVSYLPEGATGEVLLVLVEAHQGAKPAEIAGLPGRCARAIVAATGLEPERVVALAAGTLPRTSSGKLRRQETLRRYLAGELTPPDPVTAPRLLGAMARSSLAYLRTRRRSR